MSTLEELNGIFDNTIGDNLVSLDNIFALMVKLATLKEENTRFIKYSLEDIDDCNYVNILGFNLDNDSFVIDINYYTKGDYKYYFNKDLSGNLYISKTLLNNKTYDYNISMDLFSRKLKEISVAYDVLKDYKFNIVRNIKLNDKLYVSIYPEEIVIEYLNKFKISKKVNLLSSNHYEYSIDDRCDDLNVSKIKDKLFSEICISKDECPIVIQCLLEEMNVKKGKR